MIRPRVVWMVAAALGAAAPALRAAPADYLGKPVQSVRFELEGRTVQDHEVAVLVETKVGQTLTMAQVRETITHLFSLGRYEDVRARVSAVGGGVALVYELQPLHPIAGITFAGQASAPGIDGGRLRRALVDRYGSSPPAGRVADMARLVESELAARGYLRAKATPELHLEHDPDRATLVFSLAPGTRARVRTVSVNGSAGMPEPELLNLLGLTPGAAYERDAINRRLERYIAVQRKRGHYEARVSVSPRLADEDRVVDLTINASEGPRVRVVFAGDPLPSGSHDDLVPVAREGSSDEDLLEDASLRIEGLLHAQGFRDATAPHKREESDGEVRLTFTITRGPQYRVGVVNVSGNVALPSPDFAIALRTRVGQPFSRAALDADVAGLEDLYRRRGFGAARIEANVETEVPGAAAAQVSVAVRLQITEGPRTLVGSVRVQGNASVQTGVLLRDVGLKPGQPFFLTQVAVDRDTIQLAYVNLGYANASVETNPGLSADGTRADVVFTVREGPRLMVDHVLVAGNVRTSRETIERELQIHEGDPLGLAAVNESQRRLAALGLFRRVRITELGHGEESRRDLLVTVEESRSTTIGYGGGIEAGQRTLSSAAQNGAAVERLEVAPRGFFEVGRRNLFGKNRSVNLFTGLSLRPAQTGGSTYGFSEYRVLGTFREPRVLGTSADLSLTGTVEQQIRSSFNFARRAFGTEVARRLSRTVSLSGNYQIQRTRLFDEQFSVPSDKLFIDRIFPQVLLSSFSSSIVRDTRDDRTDPTAGQFFSANGQIAARRIGSEVGLAKSFFTAQTFHPVAHAHGTVFAGSVRVGIATGFPRDVVQTDANNQPVLGANGQPVVVTVRDLPASERFFAGGDTTMRGFALDRLGAPNTLDPNGFPLGGNALVILNAELRVPVRGGLGIVGFVDAGNVFARTAEIDPSQIRTAVGFGVRYKSPVGPIRVDLGFKLGRRDTAPGVLEPLTALHISLGQAF